MMLLYDPADPSFDDAWIGGQRFQNPPQEPVIVTIIPGNEEGDLLPYFGTSTLMSDAFYGALREAGVDNLDAYEAQIQSEDGSLRIDHYKAFNLIGVVSATDRSKTIFRDPAGSRIIDASIESLVIDPEKAKELAMFRLAEYVGAVVVHERIKRALEAKRFPHVAFREPSEFIS